MLFNQGMRLGVGQKATVIVAALALLGGFSLFIYGEWGPSIGTAAMGARVGQTVGVALFGISMLMFCGLFAWLDVRVLRDTAPTLRKAQGKQLVRELGTVALNVLVYGGTVVLFLGCIAALDDIFFPGGIFVLLLMVGCVAGFVAYRRYRHRHKATYEFMGDLALLLVLLAMGLVGLTGAVSQGSDVTDDLVRGPITINAIASDVQQNHPRGRFRALRQDSITVRYDSEDGQRYYVAISQADWPEAVRQQNDQIFSRVTLYPNSGIFVEAQPWAEGAQVMADHLEVLLPD